MREYNKELKAKGYAEENLGAFQEPMSVIEQKEALKLYDAGADIEDLTDMQNHVLPYLQSFCSLEEKGVKEKREQQVAEKNESREAVPRTGVEASTAVKDAGKAERKTVEQKKAMAGKEKKPSIHERLEINKRIIQEKQGKDKPERGADLSVRTV